jgi:hypothetical protein
MKLLLTTLIGLTLSTLALASEPDLLVRPFQTKNGTRLTCTFFIDGGSTIHAFITFPKGDQFDVTLQPRGESISRTSAAVLISKIQRMTIMLVISMID